MEIPRSHPRDLNTIQMIGNNINGYEIRSLIGYGGTGTVYLAQHPTLGRTAVVKVLRRVFAEDQPMVAGFLDDVRVANAIHHPNIIEVMDVGRLGDGLPYVMTELLDGETLGQRLRRQGRMTVRQMLPIVQQAAAALGAAHARGVVHGALKPENLFLAGAPEGGERVKVLDFGIARLRSAGDPDSRIDIHAMGTLMYRMVCGRAPFSLAMDLPEAPTPPRALNPDIPLAIEKVILRALARDPGDRFATMEELAASLEEAAPVAARGRVLTLVPAHVPPSR